MFKKYKWLNLLLSSLTILFGISLVLFPTGTKYIIITIFGILVLVYGIVSIVNYFVYGNRPFGFIYGVGSSLFGVIIICSAKIIAEAAILGIAFAIMFIFKGLFMMQNAIDYRRLGFSKWWISFLFSLLILSLGIFVIINPLAGDRALMTLIGIVFIVNGVEDIVDILYFSRKMKNVKILYQKDLDELKDKDIIEM